MSYRINLYNVTNVHRDVGPCVPLVEWSEVPHLLCPLLAHGARIDPAAFAADAGRAGLFAVAQEGVAALARLYDFIDRHADALIDDLPAYHLAQAHIAHYLSQQVTHPWLFLDTSDAFDVEEVEEDRDEDLRASGLSYLLDTRLLLADLAERNAQIERAIAEDSPGLLCQGALARHGELNFREELNHPVMDHGWALFTEMDQLGNSAPTIPQEPVISPPPLPPPETAVSTPPSWRPVIDFFAWCGVSSWLFLTGFLKLSDVPEGPSFGDTLGYEKLLFLLVLALGYFILMLAAVATGARRKTIFASLAGVLTTTPFVLVGALNYMFGE
jgi:hypothetical protein